jgi:circadian clock protein KaiC
VNEIKRSAPQPLSKRATGIEGFDELSGGGLPRNRTTLVMGGPGSGKTVFSLQVLVNAAHQRNEAGIFVAFEERSPQVIANAATFDWGLPALAEDQIYILDAHLSPTIVQSGEFDLSGILAILKAKKEAMNARWIVFDGMDVLLTLLRDPLLEMREIYRIRDWLGDNELTAIITVKMDSQTSAVVNYGFMQFMVDCVIRFDQRMEYGVPAHRLQITKYRGSSFASGEFPLSFGLSGIEVAPPNRRKLFTKPRPNECPQALSVST